MLIKLLCYFFGGFWGIRERIKKTKSGLKKRLILWIYLSYLQEKNCYIGYTTEFVSRPTFPHGLSGIFIADDVIIGKNCTIFHNVTIGSNALIDSKNLGSPKIGNNVFIGAGATIIGGITIGDNCRIGANCTIAKNIPSDCLVVMERPRIIPKEDMNNTYYICLRKFGWVRYFEGKPSIETDPRVVEFLNKEYFKYK
jgi:serine O-acetyltransferase